MNFFGPIFLVMFGVTVVSFSRHAQAFRFEDLEKVNAVEQAELLDLARLAVTRRDFIQSRDYIEQARRKGYNPKAIEAAESYYRREYMALEEQKRRDEAVLQARIFQEETARRQLLQVNASGNKGGTINCAHVVSDSGLYGYCSSGSCDGFANDHSLWRLCKMGDASGYSKNYAFWNYIQNGDASGFSSNFRAWEGAKQNSGSLANRKRFAIYYLRGYIYLN